MGQYFEDTGFLFAQPGFMQGVASALDIGGTLIQYNVSNTPQEADTRALASDWAITGNDIKAATEHLVEENKAT